MAITHLRWLCAALFLAASVNNAFAVNAVQVRNGSTTFYELPPSAINGGRVGGLPASHSYSTHVGQPIPVSQLSRQGLEIPAQKVKAPFGARFGWNAATVRNAVKVGLKFGKASLWGIAGTYALKYLLDKTGWFEQDGQLMYRPDDPIPEIVPSANAFINWKHPTTGAFYDSPTQACTTDNQYCDIKGACEPRITNFNAQTQLASGGCYIPGTTTSYGAWSQVSICPNNTVITDSGCAVTQNSEPQPVTDQMIDQLDLSGYEPKPSDIPFISPHLGNPDQITITEQPTPIKMPTETTTSQNPDGSTTTTATDTTINNTINNNAGDLSITTTETTTTTVYEDGTQVSKKTETKTKDHSDSTPDSKSDQPIKVEFPEIPTDCDFFPTACAFFEWVKQPFEEESPPDLKPVQEITGLEQTRTIDFGSAQCPAPIEMDTVLAGHLTLSFQPWCDFAGMIKYLVLAAAYLLAIRINLGVIRG